MKSAQINILSVSCVRLYISSSLLSMYTLTISLYISNVLHLLHTSLRLTNTSSAYKFTTHKLSPRAHGFPTYDFYELGEDELSCQLESIFE